MVNKNCGPLGSVGEEGCEQFINGKDNGNGPYFPSATRNRTSTDRAKAGGALILPPPPLPSLSPSVRYFTGI